MATGGGLLHLELFSEDFPRRMGATSQHADAKARTGGEQTDAGGQFDAGGMEESHHRLPRPFRQAAILLTDQLLELRPQRNAGETSASGSSALPQAPLDSNGATPGAGLTRGPAAKAASVQASISAPNTPPWASARGRRLK